VAIVILLVTVIGIPLALLALVLYFALLLAGYVMTGIGVGDFALARWRPAAAERKGWRIGAAVLGLFVIALLARIPWVGGLVTFLALLAGFGALLMQVRAARAPAA
ncbi:MAG TPA: polymer-forming cytoskeletal protein, partial [Burkholderiaceae bacterium]|nr:polymer-forming cytoskeletal protein [Burkholderiaceae bacterium]